MFHDQARTELEERLTRPVDEFIQDGPPRGVSDRAIDVHVPGLRKWSLACQGLDDTQAWACMSTVPRRRISAQGATFSVGTEKGQRHWRTCE